MKHFNEGQLRAYLDREIEPSRRGAMDRHLASCEVCQEELGRIEALSTRVTEQIQMLDPSMEPSLDDTRLAWGQFQERTRPEPKEGLVNRIFQPQYRTALVLAVIVMVVAGLFAFPQVRVAAGNFLGLFRVQQIAIVEINPSNLPQDLGSSRMLEQVLTENVSFSELGDPQEVAGKAQASAQAEMAVRLPEDWEANSEILVQPGAEISFDVDLGRVMALLNEIGYADLELPKELDGENVTMTVPASVLAGFGQCDLKSEIQAEGGAAPGDEFEDCTVLVQMPSPTISAPDGLDLPAIGEAFLQVMGMSPEEAENFSQNIDWTTTLVVPIPRDDVIYQDVEVDGVQGTLMRNEYDRRNPNYMLLWVKDGIVYALTGPGYGSDGLKIANSLN